jgi:Ca2+-binding RTX toxin-like protein
MYARTRLATLTAAALFSASLLAAGGVATASAAGPMCDGLPATIVVPAPGMVTNGTINDDVIVGTAGVDTINGRAGNDHICAGDGNDNLTGGPGDDRAFGEHGDDDFLGGLGDDFFDGGPHIEGDRGNGNAGLNLCVNTEVTVNC